MPISRTKADKQAATERLREWLKDGDTLWFILRHRSASGLQRVYSVKQLEHVDRFSNPRSFPKEAARLEAEAATLRSSQV